MMKNFRLAALALAALAFSLPALAVDMAVDGNLRLNCSTATASGGAATLANKCGIITSEVLTTALNSTYTLTLTNSLAAAGDIVLASVTNSPNTGGSPALLTAVAGSSSITFIVTNYNYGTTGTGAAFNNAIKINYLLLK